MITADFACDTMAVFSGWTDLPSKVCVISMCVLILMAYSSQVGCCWAFSLSEWWIWWVNKKHSLLIVQKLEGSHGLQGGCWHHLPQWLCHHGEGWNGMGYDPGNWIELNWHSMLSYRFIIIISLFVLSLLSLYIIIIIIIMIPIIIIIIIQSLKSLRLI